MANPGPKATNYNVVQYDGSADTVGSETVTVYTRDENANILSCSGTTIPTSTTAGYAKGCTFIKTDVAGGTGGFYLNKGTTASCTFTLVTQA